MRLIDETPWESRDMLKAPEATEETDESPLAYLPPQNESRRLAAVVGQILIILLVLFACWLFGTLAICLWGSP